VVAFAVRDRGLDPDYVTDLPMPLTSLLDVPARRPTSRSGLRTPLAYSLGDRARRPEDERR